MKKIFGFSLEKVIPLYWLLVVGLFLYSFTQVDLGLTLTRWEQWQGIQKFFQHIGYFDRPFSTFLYIVLLVLFFAFYCLFLFLAKKQALLVKKAWKIIVVTAFILTLSYNAFSYDLFNYVFDAKIVTYYHQTPYERRALDYPKDPMMGFMHWIQRTYPYGPTWLLLTIPLSFIGMQYLLPTLIFFKVFLAACFLGSVYFLGKILRELSPKDEVLGIVFFALNPLVLFESLVSAHNDIAMIFFALFGFYSLIKKRYIVAFSSFLLFYGVKFATKEIPLSVHIGVIAALVLGTVALRFLEQRSQIDWKKVFFWITLGSVLPIIYASVRTNFQPWYLLMTLSFASLALLRKILLVALGIMSFFALLEYIPFLYTGNWNPPIPTILFWITAAGVFFSLLTAIAVFFKK